MTIQIKETVLQEANVKSDDLRKTSGSLESCKNLVAEAMINQLACPNVSKNATITKSRGH